MADTEKYYLFNRDSLETKRYSLFLSSSIVVTNPKSLNAQHGYLQGTINFHIHPSIPLNPNDPNVKIAEVATGTGIWLTETAQRSPPTWQFDGFDISPAQFPSLSEWPPNVKYHVHDALAPFPEEFHGYYDVVAVRMICAALGNEEWEIVCANLKQCLSESCHQSSLYQSNYNT